MEKTTRTVTASQKRLQKKLDRLVKKLDISKKHMSQPRWEERLVLVSELVLDLQRSILAEVNKLTGKL